MSTPLRVLILEDRPSDAELMLHELRRAGFEPDWRRVETEADYLAQLEGGFDVILADHTLPQFDSRHALLHLQARGLDIPFIVVTGSLSEEAAVETMKQGAADYLLKDRLVRLGPAVAQALDQKRLRDERRQAEAAEQEQRTLAEALRDTAAALNSTLHFDEVLDRILSIVGRVVPHDAANIVLLDAPRGSAHVARSRGYVKRGLEAWLLNTTFPVAETYTLRRMVDTGQPLLIPDTDADPGWVTLPELSWLRSYVGAPIRVKGQVVGFLNLDSTTPGFFTPAHLERLQAFADQVAVAVENAQLYDEVRRRAEGLETLVVERTAEIRREQERTLTILNNVADAVLVTDLAGTPVITNPVADALLREDEHGQSAGALRRWLRELAPDSGSLKIAVGGRVLHATVTYIHEEDQNVGYVIALHDITRLDELDRLKTKFVSDVSHELRTPATNLKLYLELLERGKPEKRDQYMAVLKEQAVRLGKLIENILDLTRLERDKETMVFVPVDLNAVAGSVVAAHQAQAEAAGLALNFEPDTDLPPVHGEQNRLMQVVTNLVANAINYTPAGQVRVSTRLDLERNTVCLEVQDTGMGVAPEDMPHLFERFYRGKHASQLDIPGSGLGLGIAKEIVDLHGGAITIHSKVGVGTTFTVTLPVQASTTEEARETNSRDRE